MTDSAPTAPGAPAASPPESASAAAPSAQSLDAAPASTIPAPHRWFWRILIAISVFLLLLAGLFLWGAYRYQALIGFAQEARTQYAELNRASPFSPPAIGIPVPAASASAEADRWSAVLRVRQRTSQSLSPRLRQTVRDILSGALASPFRAVLRLLAIAPELDGVLAAHAAALRAEKMSPDEYRWRLGLAASAAARAPERYPAGAAYHRIVAAAMLLAKASGRPLTGLPGGGSPEAMLARLEAHYAGRAPADAAAPADLAPLDDADGALDLFLIATQWIQEDEVPLKSPLKSLLG